MEMRLVVLRLAAGLALAAGAGACSGGGDDGPPAEDAAAVPAAPTAVPRGAELVEENIEFGQDAAAPGAPADSAHLFYAMTCVDDVLAITTTKETVYAELPCARALPQEVIGRFAYVPVRMRIVTAEPAKLYIESKTAGSVEFTVGRVWIERR
jgi:hypothetical protein